MKVLYKILRNICGLLGLYITSLGVILGLIAWNNNPGKLIEIKLITLSIIASISLLLIIVLTTFIVKLLECIEPPFPKIITVKPLNGSILILLGQSNIFSHGSLVSIYCINDGYEQLIGLGEVINIQDDKRVQILLTQRVSPDEDIYKKLLENNATVFEKILIKPYVQNNMIKSYSQGRP
jgi:hypothetical protein